MPGRVERDRLRLNESCWRPSESDGAVTVIVATGGSATLNTSAFDVTAPSVAVIVTAPGPTPVTRPLASTVATRMLFEAHVKLWPVTTFPLESCATACAWRDWKVSSEVAPAVTVTPATA